MKKFVYIVIIVVTGFTILTFAEQKQSVVKPERELLNVGIFDSRAVTVAYVHSGLLKEKMRKMQKEMERAKADGDTKKVERLEKQPIAWQKKIHRQGFGTAPIDDILENIKDALPGIAKQADVDVIVSKWDIVYQNPTARLTDITDEMVKPFDPDEKTLNIIKDLKGKPPVSEKAIEEHESGKSY